MRTDHFKRHKCNPCLKRPHSRAVVSSTSILAQAANASHLKVTLSTRLSGPPEKRGEGRGGEGGCKSRRAGEELAEWKSSSSSAVRPFFGAVTQAAPKIFNNDDASGRRVSTDERESGGGGRRGGGGEGGEVRCTGQGSLEHCSNLLSHQPPHSTLHTPSLC